MARPVRIEFPGAIYHVCSRMLGTRRQGRDRLFRDDADRIRFVTRLGVGVENFGIRLYLFELMSNHYHLVLETPEGNLSRFMQNLATAYTVYFNKRHDRHGHLLDGRYKAKLVSGDEYLLRLSRYVHQNPAWVSGWVRKPIKERIGLLRDYRWSSYRGYIGKAPQWDFVDEKPILAMMGGKQTERRKRYRQFVESGLASGDEEFEESLRASPSGIGDEEFLSWVDYARGKKIGESGVKEDVAFRRVILPLPPQVVLSILAKVLKVEEQAFSERRRNSVLRAVASRYLMRYAGQTQREVARQLGMTTGGAVSAQVARMPELVSGDRRLARQIREIERLLESEQHRAAGGLSD